MAHCYISTHINWTRPSSHKPGQNHHQEQQTTEIYLVTTTNSWKQPKYSCDWCKNVNNISTEETEKRLRSSIVICWFCSRYWYYPKNTETSTATDNPTNTVNPNWEDTVPTTTPTPGGSTEPQQKGQHERRIKPENEYTFKAYRTLRCRIIQSKHHIEVLTIHINTGSTPKGLYSQLNPQVPHINTDLLLEWGEVKFTYH